MTGEFVWTAEMNVAGWADLKHGQEIPADGLFITLRQWPHRNNSQAFPRRSSSSAPSTSLSMRI
jgi:hypothetical protein